MATRKVADSTTPTAARKAAKKAPISAQTKQSASNIAGTGAVGADAAKSAPAKAATSMTAVRKSAAATAAPARAATRPSAAGPNAKTATQRSSSATAADGKSRRISPEQALANTRGLLDAKRDNRRQPQSWQTLGPAQAHPGSEGFQSPGAIDKAEELHAAESHITPIQGSISTRDRHQQGKRDAR